MRQTPYPTRFLLAAAFAVGMIPAAFSETLFDTYSTVPAEERWEVPGPDEEVAGNQNGWYVTPRDIRLGDFGFAVPGKEGRSLKATEEELLIVPNSMWGHYTWRITPDGEPEAFAEWAGRFEAGKGIRLKGTLTEIGPERKHFKAMLQTERDAEPDLPVQLEFVSVEYEKPIPEVYSHAYGPHWRHVYDVYYPEGFDPETDDPLPIYMQIHGGGWGAGSKAGFDKRWTKSGFAYVTISYRYISEFQQAPEMTVPVAAPLLDAARALQDLRYHADEFGLDPSRVLLTGGSAGGATSAWLAMVDDLADPDSPDPIARMTTRVSVSTPNQAQTSIDPKQMQEWIPGITYGAHAFLTKADYPEEIRRMPRGEEKKMAIFQYWLETREQYLEAIQDFSAYAQASSDDPPMMLVYGGRKDIPVSEGGNATHHPKFGEYLNKRLQELGVDSLYWADNVSSGDETYDGWQGTYFYSLHKLRDGLRVPVKE